MQETRKPERQISSPRTPVKHFPAESLLAPLAAIALIACVAVPVVLISQGCEQDEPGPDAAPYRLDAGGLNCDAEANDWQLQVLAQAASLGDAAGLASFYGIWGAAEDAIFVVGTHGKVLFWDGEEWTVQETPTHVNLTSVWGTSATDVWAVGHEGVVLHYNGQQWSDRSPPMSVFVTVDGGMAASDAGAPVRRNLWGVWATGSPTTQAMYAVGDQGLILHFDGNLKIWSSQIPVTADGATVKIQDQLNGVWGTGANNVYIAGHFGTILVGNKNGFAKQAIDPGTTKDLLSVWGRGGSDIYVTGNSGTLVHSNGGGWRLIEGAPKQVLRSAWGPSNASSVYIVGWDGTLMRVNGGPSFSKGAEIDPFFCVAPRRRLEGIWGTLTAVPPPDAGAPDGALLNDAGKMIVPAVWAVGASGTVITGP